MDRNNVPVKDNFLPLINGGHLIEFPAVGKESVTFAYRSGVQTFRRESDRFWIIAAHPSLNVFAAGMFDCVAMYWSVLTGDSLWLRF